MSYAFWSSAGQWSVPVVIWVLALMAHRRRKRYQRMLCAIHAAPPGQLPEPPPRISWSQGMLIMFVLLPLRLVAGRRPLLGLASRRGRPLSPVALKALEADCGIIDPEPDPEPGELPAAMGGTVHSGRFPIASPDNLRSAHERILDGDVIRSLRARRQQAWLQAKAMADSTAATLRPFTSEEHARWELLHEEMYQLDRRILAVATAQERAAAKPVIDTHACTASCVVNVRAIGDTEDRWIAATPEHQEYMLQREAAEYERGRDAGHDLIRRLGDPGA